MEPKQNTSGKAVADGILPFDHDKRVSKLVGHDVQQTQHAEATPPILDRRFHARYQELGTTSESESLRCEGNEEEPPEPRSFQRSMSPTTMQRNKNAYYEKVGEEGVNNMHRFTLYETSTRFYLVGQDIMEKHFR